MGGVHFIEHNGKKICYINFVGARPEEGLQIIEAGKKLIASQPLGTVLTLTNVTDAHYNQDVSKALKEFTAHNKPYVRAGAVVGVTGLKKIIFEAVIAFSGRKLSLFDNVERAKDWLAAQ